MSMESEGLILLAYALGIVALYIVAYIILVPLKAVGKLLINSIVGGIVLLILNYFGESFSFYIPINIWTAVITGILGIPGIILMFVADKFFL